MAERAHLRALAERLGVLPSFVSGGGVRRYTSDATRVALLDAMGYDASSEAAAERALAGVVREEAGRLLEPARIVRVDSGDADRVVVRVGAEEALENGTVRAPFTWRLTFEGENGHRRVSEGRVTSRGDVANATATATPTLTLTLPSRPTIGYHVVRVEILAGGADARRAEQQLIVVPPSCPTVAEALGGRRAFGICANLYTVRSGRDWGVGDLGDLRDLATWAGEVGAAFVGINPLHALRNRGHEISPYYAMSRLYRNMLYVDVEAVPEYAESATARARVATRAFREALARARAAEHVDYEEIAALERPVLEALHETFRERHRARGTARGEAYARYVEREGAPLTDFATFVALQEHFARARRPAHGWRAWPAAYRDPRSAAVRAFREEHAGAVDFHRYVQFELDRQLGEAARAGREAGLAIGIYQDLAVGTAGGGSDPWAFPGLFLDRASVGAPPDYHAQTGQDWGLPPIDPRRLAADAYRYWIRLTRGALAHAGALRIDHVMGVARQFWIPAGRPPSDGAYVRYPAEDLLGILALESARRGAIVVGEDLGTVPPGFAALLARWGILSSQVLYFARGDRGGFLAASQFSDRALVTVNSHDLPPLPGFWRGADIALRHRVGLLANESAHRSALEARDRDRRALLNRLAIEGLLSDAREPAGDADLVAAVHAFLSRTPAPLMGVSLDDLAGETEPVNVPGLTPDQFRSWSRRMRLALEAIREDAGVARGLEGVRERAAARDHAVDDSIPADDAPSAPPERASAGGSGA